MQRFPLGSADDLEPCSQRLLGARLFVLNQAINAAANAKDLQEKFAATGFTIDPGTPEALAQRNRHETAKWGKAIRDARIEPQ